MTGESATGGESPERFEDLLKELETIVRELETGRLTLEESLERYHRGVGRLKRCYELLDAAERKIEILTRDESGNIVFSPLAPPAGESVATPANKAVDRQKKGAGS
ncbi:MAG: exodeoxyribonuclease VII small subunit [Planctomycetes bacterium]|nr:exodeoxyribonuclease VII small subunit [Planctomycetota bacterium]MBI3847480.1 exodeoxyribonuclease VII small subunit [Planctomycetota bacterium]